MISAFSAFSPATLLMDSILFLRIVNAQFICFSEPSSSTRFSFSASCFAFSAASNLSFSPDYHLFS
jgi:hypothetical protein